MVFDSDDTLMHRYMYGPGIDMILADEAFDGASGNFLDHYGNVRDLEHIWTLSRLDQLHAKKHGKPGGLSLRAFV
jgi:hypothetical protein